MKNYWLFNLCAGEIYRRNDNRNDPCQKLLDLYPDCIPFEIDITPQTLH